MDSEVQSDTSSDYEGDQNETPSASRREFLRTASGAAVMAALGISVTGCSDGNPVGSEPPEEEPPPDDSPSGITIDGNQVIIDLTADATQDLTNEGGFLLISEADVMVINVDGTTIRAFTSICTHQQCTINSFADDTFTCPCHGSAFNTNGEVVGGPAPQPLTEYGVSRSDDTVTITKS